VFHLGAFEIDIGGFPPVIINETVIPIAHVNEKSRKQPLNAIPQALLSLGQAFFSANVDIHGTSVMP
jgi:hypothetical protein